MILTGQFSAELAQSLSTLCASGPMGPYLQFNDEQIPSSGRLIIVTSSAELFPCTPVEYVKDKDALSLSSTSQTITPTLEPQSSKAKTKDEKAKKKDKNGYHKQFEFNREIYVLVNKAYEQYGQEPSFASSSPRQSLADLARITKIDKFLSIHSAKTGPSQSDGTNPVAQESISFGQLLAFMLAGVGNWRTNNPKSLKVLITEQLQTKVKEMSGFETNEKNPIEIFKACFKEIIFLHFHLTQEKREHYPNLTKYINQLLNRLFIIAIPYNNHGFLGDRIHNKNAIAAQNKVIKDLNDFLIKNESLPEKIQSLPETKASNIDNHFMSEITSEKIKTVYEIMMNI